MSEHLISIRASSWPSLFACPYGWSLSNIDKRRGPTSRRAYLGKSIHKGSEIFDKAKADGSPVPYGHAVDVALTYFLHPNDEVIDAPDDPDAKEMAKWITSMQYNYCAKIGAKRNFLMIEHRFEPVIINTEHGKVQITGQVDRMYKDEKGLGIVDQKTGKTVVKKDGSVETQAHALQMACYAILAETNLGQVMDRPSEIVGIKASHIGEVGCGFVTRGKEAILGDGTAPSLADIAAKMAKSGLFPPNPKNYLCSPIYCHHWEVCPYHE